MMFFFFFFLQRTTTLENYEYPTPAVLSFVLNFFTGYIQ
jgi:hypothetical protein